MRISDWSSDVCSSDLTAPDMVTRLAVGIVVGVALSPLVAGVQGRFGVRRGVAAAVVAGGLVLFFAAVVFVVAPPAVEQASRFSRELPATVEELYSWPVVGSRSAGAGASEECARRIAELPARLADDTPAAPTRKRGV